MKNFLGNIINSKPMFYVIPIMIIVSISGIITGKVNLNSKTDVLYLIYFIIGIIGLIGCVIYNVKKEIK